MQIDGTAIGSKLGRNYACAFLGFWERKVKEEIRRRGMRFPRKWDRFIDDIFGIWKGTVQSFLEFVQLCNSIEPRIKLTYEICHEKAVFLDVLMERNVDGSITTKLYTKDTDRQRYLHVTSDHPEHTKTGISKGQLRRPRRICSEDTDFDIASRNLTQKMTERGYKKRVVEKHFRGIRSVSRKDALVRVEKRRDQEDSVNFVTTFSSYLPDVKKIINSNYHHLQREGLQDIIRPPRLSLRRGRNLGDIIINAKPREEGGVSASGPCGSCILCRSMSSSSYFKGANGSIYNIRGCYSCKSTGVVYGMHCQICDCIVYVGKTQNSLQERFYGHRADYQAEILEKPVAHFLDEGHKWEDMRVVGLEKVEGKDDVLRVVRERFWIGKLGTLQEENRKW